MDHVDAPPELMPLEPCDCCGVPVYYRHSSPFHGRDRICRPCFMLWYDEGLIDKKALHLRRLEVYGTAPDIPRIAGGLFD